MMMKEDSRLIFLRGFRLRENCPDAAPSKALSSSTHWLVCKTCSPSPVFWQRRTRESVAPNVNHYTPNDETEESTKRKWNMKPTEVRDYIMILSLHSFLSSSSKWRWSWRTTEQTFCTLRSSFEAKLAINDSKLSQVLYLPNTHDFGRKTRNQGKTFVLKMKSSRSGWQSTFTGDMSHLD